MTILWCGSEPEDFISTNYGFTSTTYNSNFVRGRCSATSSGSYAYGSVFTPVSSIWMHFVYAPYNLGNTPNFLGIGLSKNGEDAWIGIGSTDSNYHMGIIKWDGTTGTALAKSKIMTYYNLYNKIDLQIINYGPSGIVNLYINNGLAATYTGNIAVNGQTTLDQFYAPPSNFSNFVYYIQEIIIADEDTRLMNLKTLAPDAAGDTNDWNGAYTDIDESTLNDADIIYTDAGSNDFQCNLTGMPTGTYDVKAVKIASRISQATGSLGVKLGVKTNSALHLGSTQNPGTSWYNYNEMFHINPETSQPFTPAEIDALQLAIQSQT